ncbi:MAG: DUF1573 domain-containing protein [Phycisphaerales bacterium]|jgi:hypothetical protein|nr:DUF1573 domain-containing protein [Phycisphaerales bacterium]
MQRRPEKEEPVGGLSARVLLQLSGGVLLLIAIVALAGGFFDTPPVTTPPASTPPTTTPPATKAKAPAAQAPPPKPPEQFVPDPADAERSVQVELDPPAYEFGFLRPEEVRTRTVQLTNRDTTPVRLKGTWRGCSCTTLDVRPMTLQPGDSIAVPATLTAGMTPTSKDSSVKLEIIGRPPITLPTKGEIIRGVRARPRDISTYRSRDGNAYTSTGRLMVDAPEGPPFRVLSVNGEPQQTEPSPMHAIAWDVSDYDGTTGLNAEGQPVPPFWLVETDHPETPVLEIPVRHRSIRITPRGDRPWFYVEQRANVGGIERGGSGTFTLPVKWAGGKTSSSFRGVQSSRSESDLFEAVLIGKEDKGRETEVTIRITPAPSTSGPFQGEIILEGDGFEAPIQVIGHAERASSP